MTGDNRPLSDRYAQTAKDWVEKDAAASLLEDCKSAWLSQKMKALGDMPVSRAELEVKASEEWMDYVTKTVKAREAANLAKVKLEYLRLKFNEWNNEEANERVKARL